jgi:hypothetical protein
MEKRSDKKILFAGVIGAIYSLPVQIPLQHRLLLAIDESLPFCPKTSQLLEMHSIDSLKIF